LLLHHAARRGLATAGWLLRHRGRHPARRLVDAPWRRICNLEQRLCDRVARTAITHRWIVTVCHHAVSSLIA
jgi:hypothetical protein